MSWIIFFLSDHHRHPYWRGGDGGHRSEDASLLPVRQHGEPDEPHGDHGWEREDKRVGVHVQVSGCVTFASDRQALFNFLEEHVIMRKRERFTHNLYLNPFSFEVFHVNSGDLTWDHESFYMICLFKMSYQGEHSVWGAAQENQHSFM